MYVGDVVSVLRAAAGREGTYNVATGVQTDVTTVWNELQEISGVRIEPQLEDLRGGS